MCQFTFGFHISSETRQSTTSVTSGVTPAPSTVFLASICWHRRTIPSRSWTSMRRGPKSGAMFGRVVHRSTFLTRPDPTQYVTDLTHRAHCPPSDVCLKYDGREPVIRMKVQSEFNRTQWVVTLSDLTASYELENLDAHKRMRCCQYNNDSEHSTRR